MRPGPFRSRNSQQGADISASMIILWILSWRSTFDTHSRSPRHVLELALPQFKCTCHSSSSGHSNPMDRHHLASGRRKKFSLFDSCSCSLQSTGKHAPCRSRRGMTTFSTCQRSGRSRSGSSVYRFTATDLLLAHYSSTRSPALQDSGKNSEFVGIPGPVVPQC
ncbi:hypothetical protein OG21DRAFT_255349 [Imleria badia]|nr:hypothetical protein OG21DRAFT_255349 [Imleria badia]